MDFFSQVEELMKAEKSIFIAFILNLLFSVFEFVGGILCGSTAIMSDAVHDLGDAVSIGISLVFEKISKRAANEKYTYGYVRYSLLGGSMSTLILLVGSVGVAVVGIGRLCSPMEINYDGMIVFAIVGVVVNSAAAFFTRDKGSLNRRAVNLHMLEDVLGWAAVLVMAIIMRFTDISVLDPAVSVIIAAFIFVGAVRNIGEIIGVFLEKTPNGVGVNAVKEAVMGIDGVSDVHHIHLWSLDGQASLATLHLVCGDGCTDIKREVRRRLYEVGISHVTVETHGEGEECREYACAVSAQSEHHAHCHHHHHHHRHG